MPAYTSQQQQQEARHVCGSGPIQDGRFIAAQILSVFAFALSWCWWLTLLIGAGVCFTLQIAWCCKLDRRAVSVISVGAGLASLTAIFGAVWALVDWRHYKGDQACPVFYVFGNTNPSEGDFFTYEKPSGIDRFDGCNEVSYTILFTVVAVLWILVSSFLGRFVRSPEADQILNPLPGTTTDRDQQGTVVATRSVPVPVEQQDEEMQRAISESLAADAENSTKQ